MKSISIVTATLCVVVAICVSFISPEGHNKYQTKYFSSIESLARELESLQAVVNDAHSNKQTINDAIYECRKKLKAADFWLRYLEPISYKKINGPLPVEWETEVFEKFEKPYKREGAGLTLAALYIDENGFQKDSLLRLIQSSIRAIEVFQADSITGNLKKYDHFFLCNRLFLLNLAAIYTTGFECPDTAKIIPELRLMLADVNVVYQSFNESFPKTLLPEHYIALFEKTITFANAQSIRYSEFDHFTFIKDYINPLFALNQKMINQYNVATKSYVDYSLNNNTASIFSKELYNGQNSKGIFLRVKDEKDLSEIEKIGKLLFYDPILSGNNMRSCQSCHKSTAYFTDTAGTSSLQYNRQDFLTRNTPSLINAGLNHLLMLDGTHISLQDQAKTVITNPIELGADKNEVVKKVLSCSEYKKTFNYLLKYTPHEKEVTYDHIVSAIIFYYSKFSTYYAPFDEAMNGNKNIDASVKSGFNVFMSKAQCATCHFLPQFNGVKPPYISSEFEVLGVPQDTSFKKLSADKGRYTVNPAAETLNAFRTGSIRNSEHTKPYMHNGVFTTLSQVIDFYDAGGGTGKGLIVSNQTLSSDSLHLTKTEKNNLLAFIKSLNENITFENLPEKLPRSKIKTLNTRKVGGEY